MTQVQTPEAEALERVLAGVRKLDGDLAAVAPAQFSVGLLRGRLSSILEEGVVR